VKTKAGALRNAEAFDAEVVAIHNAVRAAITGKPTGTRVFSDSLVAVESCTCRLAPSLQREAVEVQNLLKKRAEVTLEWCPGHKGATGNTLADREAKKALSREPPTAKPPTLAWVKA